MNKLSLPELPYIINLLSETFETRFPWKYHVPCFTNWNTTCWTFVLGFLFSVYWRACNEFKFHWIPHIMGFKNFFYITIYNVNLIHDISSYNLLTWTCILAGLIAKAVVGQKLRRTIPDVDWTTIEIVLGFYKT